MPMPMVPAMRLLPLFLGLYKLPLASAAPPAFKLRPTALFGDHVLPPLPHVYNFAMAVLFTWYNST